MSIVNDNVRACADAIATGIGLMMTKAFALNNAAKVYIVGRRMEKLQEAAKISPSNIVPIAGDITSKDSLREVAEKVKQDCGYVNLLCCNSGVNPPAVPVQSSNVSVAEYAKAAMEQNMEDWNDGFAANVTGAVFTAYAFLELLDAGNRRRGFTGAQSQILFTGSVAGQLRLATGNASYASTKAAVHHLVKQLSGTFVPYNIRVNALAPGLFPSDLATGLIAMGGEPKGGDSGVEGAYPTSFIPAQRLGTEEDIAGTMLFLASRAGGYFNGCILLNDGGRLGILNGTY